MRWKPAFRPLQRCEGIGLRDGQVFRQELAQQKSSVTAPAGNLEAKIRMSYSAGEPDR